MVKIFTPLVIILSIGFADSSPVTPAFRVRRSLLQSRDILFSLMGTTSMATMLYSKTNMFIQIDRNGTVSGTNQCSLKTVSMKLMSTGIAGVKMIRGVSSGRYLAMNRDGEVYSTKIAGNETMFLERLESNGYLTFASFQYYRRVFTDTFLAMDTNGTMMSGAKTSRFQVSAQFLALPMNVNC